MNWVGGARSRVKQHAEKKIQKDFFERKRLAGKVQRIRPSLSKVKTAISQDLLFLNATASATKSRPLSPGHVTCMPKPLSLERGGKDRLSMRPQRDMELPMSPIDRASSLDLVDTTTNATSFLSETIVEEGVPGGGRSLRELPRVSTQKIPRQTILDSFGPPRMNEFELERRRPPSIEECDHHTVPSEDSHHLNMSTMTESLFPPPAKRRKEHSKETGRLQGAKKYALDDMLNQNHPLPDRGVNPIQANEGAHDAHVFAAQQHGKRHTAAQNQNKHESIFTIAKGGWQEEAASRRGPQREKEGKAPHAVGYHFDFNRHDRRHAPGVEVAATRDCDARLELHYATETSVRNFATKPATTQDCDPDQLIPAYGVPAKKDPGWKGKSKLVESSHQDILPWLSSTKSASSVLSEDPFSGRKIPRVFAGPPVSTSIDFDESVFGPLRHRKGHRHGDANGGHPFHHSDASWEYPLRQGDASGGHPLHHGDANRGHPLCHSDVPLHHGNANGGHLHHRDASGEYPLHHGDASGGHHREKAELGISLLDRTQYNESVLAPIRNAKKGISHEMMAQGDGDESILAPIRAARKRCSHQLDPGRDTESIPAPIHAAQNRGSLDPERDAQNWGSLDPGRDVQSMPAPVHTARNATLHEPLVQRGDMGMLTPARNKREQVPDGSVAVSGGYPCLGERSVIAGRKSAFETMMASLEKSCTEEEVAEVIRGSPTFNSKGSRVQLEVYHEPEKDKLPPSYLSYECDDNASLPDSGQVSALPLSTASNGLEHNSKYHSHKAMPGNISVLHELMSLEEEIASHYEDGLLSQNSTDEIGEISEDPLFRRVCGNNQGHRSKCSFASSQESATLEFKHTNQPNLNSDSQGEVVSKLHDSGKVCCDFPAVVVGSGELSVVSCRSMSESDSDEISNETASRDVHTYCTLIGSIDKPSAEHSSVTSATFTTGTQTDVPSASIQVPTNPRKIELEASGNRATKGVQTDTELVYSSTQTSGTLEDGSYSVCAKSESLTNENLTVGLEKHRMVFSGYVRKEEATKYCNVACQTCSNEETLSKTGCGQGANLTICGHGKSKEAERLRRSVANLEEKLLIAESTVIWQSVIMKCLKLESNH